MAISIRKASIDYLEKCAQILEKSELGQMYFTNNIGKYIGNHLLQEGFDKQEIYVALKDNECIGFIWLQLNGIFHWFPYIHIVIVDSDYQGKGVARELMDFAQELSRQDHSDRVFLMVGDYNKNAISAYVHMGYTQVGSVPSLFVKGVDELIMMKLIL